MLAGCIRERDNFFAVSNAPRISRDRSVMTQVGEGFVDGAEQDLRQVARRDGQKFQFEIGDGVSSDEPLGRLPVGFEVSADERGVSGAAQVSDGA